MPQEKKHTENEEDDITGDDHYSKWENIAYADISREPEKAEQGDDEGKVHNIYKFQSVIDRTPKIWICYYCETENKLADGSCCVCGKAKRT